MPNTSPHQVAIAETRWKSPATKRYKQKQRNDEAKRLARDPASQDAAAVANLKKAREEAERLSEEKSVLEEARRKEKRMRMQQLREERWAREKAVREEREARQEQKDSERRGAEEEMEVRARQIRLEQEEERELRKHFGDLIR